MDPGNHALKRMHAWYFIFNVFKLKLYSRCPETTLLNQIIFNCNKDSKSEKKCTITMNILCTKILNRYHHISTKFERYKSYNNTFFCNYSISDWNAIQFMNHQKHLRQLIGHLQPSPQENVQNDSNLTYSFHTPASSSGSIWFAITCVFLLCLAFTFLTYLPAFDFFSCDLTCHKQQIIDVIKKTYVQRW